MAECSIKGCDVLIYARGLCNKHYKRLRQTGTVLDGPRARLSLEERFWKKVSKTDGCWLWTGNKNPKGYGLIGAGGSKGKMLSAHRLSYRIHKGDVSPGAYVLHSCDNPSCVNPAHLRIGTQRDNIRESFKKGRKTNPVAFGESNPRSKLTQAQVYYIKGHPEERLVDLAAKFGVSLNCIRGVRIGRTWV
jgi:HNH endonuclease